MFCFPSQEYFHNFISTLQRQMSGSGTCPGVKHPEVAKRVGGTGFYPEVTNSALFNIEAMAASHNALFNMEVPSNVLSTQELAFTKTLAHI